MCISMDACSPWKNMNNNSLIVLLYFISLFSLLLNIYQSRKINEIVEKLSRKLMNRIKMLSEFIPMKPHQMFRIDETTTPVEIEGLVLEAKRIYTITVFPFDDMIVKCTIYKSNLYMKDC